MIKLRECIQHNLIPEYEVLSENVFYKFHIPYLGPPVVKPYRPKVILTDQDGVWEKGEQLCVLIQKGTMKQNDELRQNSKVIEEIFYEPDEKIQENALTDIYVQCHVKGKEVWRGNWWAAQKFQWVDDASTAITGLRYAGYYWKTRSGSFARMFLKRKKEYRSCPLALEHIWKEMGLKRGQIAGSAVFCNNEGYVDRTELMLRSRKRSEVNTFLYYLVLTNDLFSDSAMMECGLDILPIALVVEESKLAEIQHGLTLPFPQMKNMQRKKSFEYCFKNRERTGSIFGNE